MSCNAEKPRRLMGLFCLLMIMLLVSPMTAGFQFRSHDRPGYVVPPGKSRSGPQAHVRLLKIVSIAVAPSSSCRHSSSSLTTSRCSLSSCRRSGSAARDRMIFAPRLGRRLAPSLDHRRFRYPAGGLISSAPAAHIYPFLQSRQWVELMPAAQALPSNPTSFGATAEIPPQLL